MIPCGDQKGRCMPESVWYQLSFLLTAIFKCQVLDLLPTGRLSLSYVTTSQRVWVWFTLKFVAKMKCWMVKAIPSQHFAVCF